MIEQLLVHVILHVYLILHKQIYVHMVGQLLVHFILHVSLILQIRRNTVELYFVKRGRPVQFFDVDTDLLPTAELRRPELLAYLQKRIPAMNITIETRQVSSSTHVDKTWVSIVLKCINMYLCSYIKITGACTLQGFAFIRNRSSTYMCSIKSLGFIEQIFELKIQFPCVIVLLLCASLFSGKEETNSLRYKHLIEITFMQKFPNKSLIW